MLLRKFQREKTLGEMWAAVIKTIKQPPPDGGALDAGPQMGTEPESVDAQKGTMKDVFARRLEKNIAQVCTLLKSCTHCEEESNLLPTLLQVFLEN